MASPRRPSPRIRADEAEPARKKCCGKCAFRRGSPERSDLYGWLQLVEAFTDGGIFLCHETVPGHRQEVPDGSPRLRLCRGYDATKHLGAGSLLNFAMRDSWEPSDA